MTKEGVTIRTITSNIMVEPIAVAVDNVNSYILVADNGLGAVLVFDQEGKIIKKISPPSSENISMRDMSSLIVSRDGKIIVADKRILIFNNEGKLLKHFGSSNKNLNNRNVKKSESGRYCGLALTECGKLVAARHI